MARHPVQGFENRADAGRRLVARLRHLGGRRDLIVLALPRGGVAVARPIACALNAPLDVLNVRALAVPAQDELAMGAIGTGGIRVLDDDVIHSVGIRPAELEAVSAVEARELTRREVAFRSARPAPELRNRAVVLVDDGVATGATIRAAIAVVRHQHPSLLVVAVPVAQANVLRQLSDEADEVECLVAPRDLGSIGEWYDDFAPLDDADVRAVLAPPSRAATYLMPPGRPTSQAET